METEETVLDTPVADERLTGLEELGKPAVCADMGIEGTLQVVDHPVDGLAALGLAEVVTAAGTLHLGDSEASGGYPRLEGG